MDKNHILLFFVGIFIFIIIFNSFENFPYGSYTKSETLGRLLPRSRDRDTDTKYHLNTEENNIENEEKNDAEVNHIQLNYDESINSNNYIWDSTNHFPYGGYIYDRSYPVYLAKNICPPETPYYNTINGLCIAVDIPNKSTEISQLTNIPTDIPTNTPATFLPIDTTMDKANYASI